MAEKNVLVFVENSRGYGRGLLRGIAKYAKIHGSWNFLTRPQPYSQPRTFRDLVNFKDLLKDMDQPDLDGIITRELPPSLMRDAAGLNIPTIVIPYMEEYPQGLTNRIATDSKAIAEMVAQYFIEKGFKQFAYSGYDSMFWSQKRKSAFGDYLEQSGFPLNVYDSATESGNWIAEKESLAAWLKELPKPIGILTCTDDRGLQLIEACRHANVKVPEEVSIVGVDNDHLVCDLSSIALSSVDLTTAQAGYEAAELLARQMDGEPIHDATIKVHPKRIITRQSSDILAIDDAMVAKAMEYIRENSRTNIKVDDVVAATWSSRRVLELKFRKILGVTIAGEIRRQKIEKICELLTETVLPVKQIAEITGFETSKHIARYFAREKGMTLLKYRKIMGKPAALQ
ncbi:MAG: DNA-binding transcriptional regulator [Verrucomicrobiota bacterium]